MDLRKSLYWVVAAAFLFAATPASAGTVSLAWDPVAAPDLAGYRVFYGTVSSVYTEQLDVGLATSATVPGLADCTNHYIAVKAYDTEELESPEFSAEIEGWPRPIVLSADPDQLTAGSQVLFTVSGTNFKPGAQITLSDAAITVTDVTVNDCSELVVSATIGSGAQPGPVDVTVVNPSGVLGTGAALLAVVSDGSGPTISGVSVGQVTGTSAVVSWQTDEPADRQVWFRRSGESSYSQTTVEGPLGTDHGVLVEGLSPETTYEFHVRSADAAGNVTTSADDSFSTGVSPYHYVRIEPESGLVTAPVETYAGAESFRGAWVAVAAGAPAGTPSDPAGLAEMGYYVPTSGTWFVWVRMFGPDFGSDSWFEAMDDGDFASVFPDAVGAWEWVEARSYSLAAGLHTMRLGGREAGARVDRVLITDDPGFHPTEQPGDDVVAPDGAEQLVAQPGTGSILLSWTVPSDPDVSRVVVRYRTDGRFPETPSDGVPLLDVVAVPGSDDQLQHTGIEQGTTCSYSVFTVDDSGNASDPETVEAAPFGDPPGQVNNVHRTDIL